MRFFGLVLLALAVSLSLDSSCSGQTGTLTLDTKVASPGTSGVELPVGLEHTVAEGVGGFSFGLDHDETTLDLVEVVYVGPIVEPDFVDIEAASLDPFATVGVIFSFQAPVALLPPSTPVTLVHAVYDVRIDATPGAFSPVIFAALGNPVIVVQLATPIGPIAPVTVNGGVTVLSAVLAGDIPDRLWFPSAGDSTVSVVVPDGNVEDTPSAAPEQTPSAVAVGANGVIWTTFEGSDSVVRIDSNTGAPYAVLDVIATGLEPGGIALDPLGNAWVSNFGDGTVSKISATGQVLLGGDGPPVDSPEDGLVGPAVTVGSGPRGIAIDLVGNVWVACQTSQELYKLDSGGELSALVDDFDPGSLPGDLAIDRSGFLWVTLMGSDEVEQRASDGVLVETFDLNPGGGPAVAPDSVAIRGAGQAWVAGSTDGSVHRLEAGLPVFSFPSGGSAASGVAIDGNGQVWITDSGGNVARSFDADGVSAGFNPVAIGSMPGFRGDASGYVQANVRFPDEDFDADGFDNALEIDLGSNPFRADSVPDFAGVDELECTVDSTTVTLSWTNPLPYDIITIVRTNPDMSQDTFPLAGTATGFIDMVGVFGTYLYEVTAQSMLGSNTQSCVVVVGQGTLIDTHQIVIDGRATNLYDLAVHREAPFGKPVYYATDAARGLIYALSEDFEVLGVIQSPFQDDPTTGIAFNPLGNGGLGSLLVGSGAPSGQAMVIEIDLAGGVLDVLALTVDGVPIPGPIGGMDFAFDDVTGMDIFLASTPDTCEVFPFAMGFPDADGDGVILRPLPDAHLPGLSIPEGSGLPNGSGTLLLSVVGANGVIQIAEFNVTPAPGGAILTPTGEVIPLEAIDGENTFAGFTTNFGSLAVCGVTTSSIYELFRGVSFFIRGDTNGDGNFTLADPLNLLGSIFLAQPFESCPAAYDFNDDNILDLVDGIGLLNFLFVGGGPPAPPFPDPGQDPTPTPGLYCL